MSFSPIHRGGEGPPLLCLHGFADSWRSFELVLPFLERAHEVLAPTLPGHAGGPPLAAGVELDAYLAAAEATLDDAGVERAHILGNSLGGYLALALASRGRARSVVALAPAGGWADGDPLPAALLDHFERLHAAAVAAAPSVDALVATPEGRRQATAFTTVRYRHLPAELVAHQVLAAARCQAAGLLAPELLHERWPLSPEAIDCPLRIVWGNADRVLPWPEAAVRFRSAFPHADWVELDDVGHCPQLDVPLETAALVLGVSGG